MCAWICLNFGMFSAQLNRFVRLENVRSQFLAFLISLLHGRFFCLHASSSLVSSSACAVYFHVIPSHMQIKFICWRRTYKYMYHLGDFSSTFGICVELFLSIGHIQWYAISNRCRELRHMTNKWSEWYRRFDMVSHFFPSIADRDRPFLLVLSGKVKFILIILWSPIRLTLLKCIVNRLYGFDLFWIFAINQ